MDRRKGSSSASKVAIIAPRDEPSAANTHRDRQKLALVCDGLRLFAMVWKLCKTTVSHRQRRSPQPLQTGRSPFLPLRIHSDRLNGAEFAVRAFVVIPLEAVFTQLGLPGDE